MQKFTVTRKEEGQRLDKYLKKLLPQAADGFLYKMLRKKNITLNGKKSAGNETILAGDSVELFFSEETFQKFSGKFKTQTESLQNLERVCRSFPDIHVIYEDEDILILDKPAGVLTQKAEKDDISLNEWMLGYLLGKGVLTEEIAGHFRPSVCNRLDRNTSGLVLCGKSIRGSQFLSKMLRNRSLRKYYTAFAQGEIRKEIRLEGYLKKEEEKNFSRILQEEKYRSLVLSRPEAEKEYKRIETAIRPVFYDPEKDFTKLEVLLVTGKSHQIRAHLAQTGHPILGDYKYGWKPRNQREEALKYQMLHACRIEFPEIEGEFAGLSGKCVRAPEPEYFV